MRRTFSIASSMPFLRMNMIPVLVWGSTHQFALINHRCDDIFGASEYLAIKVITFELLGL